MIALDGDEGTGSGRSIPAFDLLGGLDACAEHLLRHGGHRAAAGCTIARERGRRLPRRLRRARRARSSRPRTSCPTERVDAVVAGDELGLALAEELERLAPFGIGNPSVSLLVPAARLVDARPMGEEGRHVRFTVEAGGHRARAVAFGMQPAARRRRGPRRDVHARAQRVERRGRAAAGPAPRPGARARGGRRWPASPRTPWPRRWPSWRRRCRWRARPSRAGRRPARPARRRRRRHAGRARGLGRARARRLRRRAPPPRAPRGPPRRLRRRGVARARARPRARSARYAHVVALDPPAADSPGRADRRALHRGLGRRRGRSTRSPPTRPATTCARRPPPSTAPCATARLSDAVAARTLAAPPRAAPCACSTELGLVRVDGERGRRCRPRAAPSSTPRRPSAPTPRAWPRAARAWPGRGGRRGRRSRPFCASGTSRRLLHHRGEGVSGARSAARRPRARAGGRTSRVFRNTSPAPRRGCALSTVNYLASIAHTPSDRHGHVVRNTR